MRDHLGFAFVLILLVVRAGDACAQIVRDSAGVRIVSTALPTKHFTLSKPELVIGGAEAEPEYELYQVVGAVRFSDGRVAVALQGNYSVRFYDADGSYRSTFGRRGNGPGEFQTIGDLLHCGPYAVAIAIDRNAGYILRSDGRQVGTLRLNTALRESPKQIRCNDTYHVLATGYGRITQRPPGAHRANVG